MRRLVCAFVVRNPPKTAFLASRPNYEPVHEILVLIAYARTLQINTRVDVSNNVRGLKFSPSLHLRPCFVYTSSKGSGESVHMHRLARTFASRRYDMYSNLVHVSISYLDKKVFFLLKLGAKRDTLILICVTLK